MHYFFKIEEAVALILNWNQSLAWDNWCVTNIKDDLSTNKKNSKINGSNLIVTLSYTPILRLGD